MIERQFVKQNMREFQIEEFVAKSLTNVGHSHTKMVRTPLGEKIIVYASRPGLVVGRQGQNIKKLTEQLKKKFKLENPQIEIAEVENINLDARIVAERIASSLERFGTTKFKGTGHKIMKEVMGAGALGIEILISGKVPSSRARRWRFYSGYLKKCGDIALTGVDKAYATANLKSGIVGIQVRIMPPQTKLPDTIKLIEEVKEVIEEVKEGEETKEEKVEEKSEEKTEKEEKKETKKEAKPEAIPAIPEKKEEKAGKEEKTLKEEIKPKKEVKKESEK
ncbi:30S ribosomal protein S3 [Candidatus Woesearchaeota archaeon]|nr:30S ribosomal protein S3 [Candidatus Woesearchaeota archaeon]